MTIIARKVPGSDELVAPANYYFAAVPMATGGERHTVLINCPKCSQVQMPPPGVKVYERVESVWRWITSFGKVGRVLTLEQMVCRFCFHSFSIVDGKVTLSDGPIK